MSDRWIIRIDIPDYAFRYVVGFNEHDGPTFVTTTSKATRYRSEDARRIVAYLTTRADAGTVVYAFKENHANDN